MKYEEYYKTITENFKNKIQTEDKLLKIKIFNSLLNWYKKNFEEEIKKQIENNNELAIITMTQSIEEVCNKNDLEKIKITYTDETYEKFIELSDKIYTLVKDFVKNNKKITEEELKLLYAELKNYDEINSEILKDKYKYYKSECILDLEYLKNEGNVEYYSFRTNRFLNSLKNN